MKIRPKHGIVLQDNPWYPEKTFMKVYGDGLHLPLGRGNKWEVREIYDFRAPHDFYDRCRAFMIREFRQIYDVSLLSLTEIRIIQLVENDKEYSMSVSEKSELGILDMTKEEAIAHLLNVPETHICWYIKNVMQKRENLRKCIEKSTVRVKT